MKKVSALQPRGRGTYCQRRRVRGVRIRGRRPVLLRDTHGQESIVTLRQRDGYRSPGQRSSLKGHDVHKKALVALVASDTAPAHATPSLMRGLRAALAQRPTVFAYEHPDVASVAVAEGLPGQSIALSRVVSVGRIS